MIMRAKPSADDLPDRPKVLLVDDDEVNLLLTSVALQDQGFAVTEASGGEAAIRILADWLPDIVVLDAVMPGLDGFETCRELRVLPGFESLPVLMLTGLDDDASITRAYEAGATDFFVKSTQWRLLAGRLRYLLRASRTRVELERSKSRLARAQDLARMGSFDWRRGQDGPVFSIEGLRVFGFGPGDQPAFRGLLRMVPEEERKAFLELTHSAMDRSTVVATDIHARLVDGRQRIVHIEAEPEFNEHGNLIGYTGIVQDVTDRRLAEDRIRHLANFDTLTGLPNRALFTDRLRQGMARAARGKPMALLFLDVDRFKSINDTFGHEAGDKLLKVFAGRMQGAVRQSDTVARLAGDEFTIILEQLVGVADARVIAAKLIESLRQPIALAGRMVEVTASIGVAMCAPGDSDDAALLRRADEALYEAKRRGRDGFHCAEGDTPFESGALPGSVALH